MLLTVYISKLHAAIPLKQTSLQGASRQNTKLQNDSLSWGKKARIYRLPYIERERKKSTSQCLPLQHHSHSTAYKTTMPFPPAENNILHLILIHWSSALLLQNANSRPKRGGGGLECIAKLEHEHIFFRWRRDVVSWMLLYDSYRRSN